MTTSNKFTKTEQYKNQRDRIIARRDALNISSNRLAANAGVSPATLSQSLTGKYSGDIAGTFAVTLSTLDALEKLHDADNIMPFCETSVYKTAAMLCDEAFTHRKSDLIGLLPAHVGVGKTTALDYYVQTNPHAVKVCARKGMAKSEVLGRLMHVLGVPPTAKTNSAKQEAVALALELRPRLLILDETNLASDGAIETMRGIADTAKSGLLFSGREMLAEKFASNQGPMGEISSRIITRIQPIRRLTADDIMMIIDASVVGDISTEAKSMLYQGSESNGRELEKLIIKLAVFKKNGKEITAEVISKIYTGFVQSGSIAWQNHQQQNH